MILPGHFRNRAARLIGVIAVLFLWVPHAAAQVREEDLKAAFLFNFAQFVTWPQEAFASTNSPLVIGIFGDDPFGNRIDALVKDEKIDGHPLEVRRLRAIGDATECHILYIPESEASRAPRILRAVQGRPVLTVSDLEGFATSGGMISFYRVGERIRFRVNPGMAKQAGLELSSKLLRVAQVVDD